MLFKNTIEDFIDRRNKGFVDEIIKSGFSIEVQPWPELTQGVNPNAWSCWSGERCFHIRYYQGHESIESFTHEIFHAYLILIRKFADNNVIHSNIKDDSNATLLFPYRLLVHINNSFAHEKSLPIYLNAGFPKEKFMSDYDLPPVLNSDIANDFFKRGLPNDGIRDFIANHFSCVDCRNELLGEEVSATIIKLPLAYH